MAHTFVGISTVMADTGTGSATVTFDTSDLDAGTAERDGLVAVIGTIGPTNAGNVNVTPPIGWTTRVATGFSTNPRTNHIVMLDGIHRAATYPIDFTVDYGAGNDITAYAAILTFRRPRAFTSTTSELGARNSTLVPGTWDPTLTNTRDGYAIVATVNPHGSLDSATNDAGFTVDHLQDEFAIAHLDVTTPATFDLLQWDRTPGPGGSGSNSPQTVVAALWDSLVPGGWWIGKAPIGPKRLGF